MARIQILTPEEIAARDQKPQGTTGRHRSAEREALISAYKEQLAPLEPGYGGEVELEAGENKGSVRRALHAAADDLGLFLNFRPIKDTTRISFRVITAEEKAARPKRGGGRPRKQAA